MAGRWGRRGGIDGDGAGPNLSDGLPAGRARNRRVILRIMRGYYKEAIDALPLERMPALVPRLLDAGVCFGFGDPVTNIIANTLCFVSDDPDDGARKRKRKRNPSRDARKSVRKGVLSKIFAAGEGDAPPPPEAPTIAERSLDGLVAFLTSYYRHLSIRNALQYLRLARVDLLVAVRLIDLDRGHPRKEEFRLRSLAALKCAALSASLANVDAFLAGSAAIVCHLTNIAPAPAQNCRRLSVQDVAQVSELLEKPPSLKNKLNNHMNLAAMRCHQYELNAPPSLMDLDSLRGILLDRIHVVYLKAISRMPIEDFLSRHHRGLLKAGFCYGPFNPIANIIVNTVWYDTVFPAPESFKIDMICTQLLDHVESRSLDGLIKLLIACTSKLSTTKLCARNAMVYLLKSNLDLPQAIQMAGQDGYGKSRLDTAAYRDAADASFHPEPEAYARFVMESLPRVQAPINKLLTTQTLPSSKIHDLSTFLSLSRPCSYVFKKRSCSYKSLVPTDELTKDAREMVSRYKENYFSQQNFVRKKVEATLQNYGQAMNEEYELSYICTVNGSVGNVIFRDTKFPYSHVNFWASPKDGTSTVLFFAQVSNDDEDNEHHLSFCRPVSSLSTNARCCYCESQGTRILHTIDSYCGGAVEFEKMTSASGRCTITNPGIISHGNLGPCPMGILGEEYIYFDPDRDAKFIQAMNRTVWELKRIVKGEMNLGG